MSFLTQNLQFYESPEKNHLKVNFSKARQWNKTITKQTKHINLSEVVDHSIEKNLNKTPDKHIALVKNIQADVFVDVKQTKLEAVFDLLISTVLNCSPTGSKINVRLRAVGNNILFEIKDCGNKFDDLA